MNKDDAAGYAAWLLKEKNRLRALIENELHRLEEYVLSALKPHGLKVQKKRQEVPIASGVRIGAGYGLGVDYLRSGVSMMKWRAVCGKTRQCHFTYDINQLYETAYKVLANKKAAEADVAAAGVGLGLEQLWSDFSLMNAQSMWFAVDFGKSLNMIPSDNLRRIVISESRKSSRKSQQDQWEKFEKYVKNAAKTSYRENNGETVSSILEYLLTVDDSKMLAECGLKKRPSKKWYRDKIAEALPAKAIKIGRPRTK